MGETHNMSSLGIGANDYEKMNANYVNAKTNQFGSYYTNGITEEEYNTSLMKQSGAVSKETGNTCTDGKDDGKIGFLSAAWHTVKGAVKGVVNGIKGCFTNSEGKFSLGKTLLTIGAGAACILFPPVGLAACGVGIVAGGTKLASGVYKAATATNDADAKDAWEQVGDGGLTLATSVVGAKAGLKAVKGTSTAGIDSVDDAYRAIDKLDDVKAGEVLDKIDDLDDLGNVTKALKETGVDTSALGNLDDSASATQKAGALLKDMKSSTVNSGKDALTKLNSVKADAKLNNDAKTYNKNSEEIAKLETKKIEAGLSKTEEAKLAKLRENNLKIEGNYENGALKNAIDAKNSAAANKAEAIQASKDNIEAYKEGIKNCEELGDKDGVKALNELIKEEQANIRNLNTPEVVTNAKNTVTTAAKNATQNTRQYLKDAKANGFKDIISTMKEMKATDQTLLSSLSKDAIEVVKFLKSSDTTYAQAVQKYGYDNVMEVMEVFAGYQLASNSV